MPRQNTRWISKLRRALRLQRKCKAVVKLTAADFASGTVRLRCPHTRYLLTEDVEFAPNPDNDFRPTTEQLSSTHPAPAYLLGFFAAITIEAPGIELDLGGHRIAQSPEFYLKQRFFAVIELAAAPFIMGQGPANFGPVDTHIVDGVRVWNGRLGLSSHHGIHGNGPKRIIIEHLQIADFEVAPIALNGAKDVLISKVRVPNSSRQVPTRATYSNARFLLPVLEAQSDLDTKTIDLRQDDDSIATLSGSEIAKELAEALASAEKDILENGVPPGTSDPAAQVFAPIVPGGLPDGAIYGLVWNVMGVAVGDFLERQVTDSGAINLIVRDYTLGRLCSAPMEVRALRRVGEGPGYAKVQTGPFGDVFRIDDAVDDAEPSLRLYSGDVLANAQLWLAKHTNTTSISQEIVEWAAQNSKDIDDFLTDSLEESLVGSIDIMAHVLKGNIGLFIQGGRHVDIKNVKMVAMENLGEPAEPLTEYATNDPKTKEYQGTTVRGVAVCSSSHVDLDNLEFAELLSEYGPVIAADIFGETLDVCIDSLLAPALDHGSLMEPRALPNPLPIAQFIRRQ